MFIKKHSHLAYMSAILFFVIQLCLCYKASAHVWSKSHSDSLVLTDDDYDAHSYITSDELVPSLITKESLERLFGKHMPDRDVFEEFLPLVNSRPLMLDMPIRDNKPASDMVAAYTISRLREEHMDAIYFLASVHDETVRLSKGDPDDYTTKVMTHVFESNVLGAANKLFMSMAHCFLYGMGNLSYESIVTITPSEVLSIRTEKAVTQNEKDFLSTLQYQYSSTMKMYKQKQVTLDKVPAFFYVNFYNWFKIQAIKAIMNEPEGIRRSTKVLYFLNIIGVYGLQSFTGFISTPSSIDEDYKDFMKSVNDIK